MGTIMDGLSRFTARLLRSRNKSVIFRGNLLGFLEIIDMNSLIGFSDPACSNQALAARVRNLKLTS